MKIKWNWGTGILIAIIAFMSFIAVLVYFLFIKEPSSENLWIGEEPWIINPDYGYYFYPAERDFDKEDPTLSKSANWQATAQKKIAATL